MISEFHYYPWMFNEDFAATQFLFCLKYYFLFFFKGKKKWDQVYFYLIVQVL